MWPLLIPSYRLLQSFDHSLILILCYYIIAKMLLLKCRSHCIIPLTISLQCLLIKLRIQFSLRLLKLSVSFFLLTSSLSYLSFCFYTPTLSKTVPCAIISPSFSQSILYIFFFITSISTWNYVLYWLIWVFFMCIPF